MKTKKASIILIVAVLISFSTMAVPLFISENASAHAPTAIYLTYKEGTLTVYITHDSDDPDTHYIETVTVLVNDVEYLSETYTSQELSEKGMVTYSYTVTASDGDVISVTAECSIDGSAAETLTVGEGGGGKDDPKDDPNDYPKDDPNKEYPPKDDPKSEDPTKEEPDNVGDTSKDGDSSQDNENIIFLLGAIIGVLVVIVVLVGMLLKKQKGTTKKDGTKKDKNKQAEWTACPKCGSSIKMGQLHSHLDTVHPKLSKTAKEKMIDQVTKRV